MAGWMSRYGFTIAIFVCLTACSWDEKLHEPKVMQEPALGGILRIAAQIPESLDPIRSKYYWESEIVLQIFDGLLRFDHNLNIAPALAQDWQISPDGRTYTFRLRRGVHFHNGREVDANDFIYSITRHLDPKSKSEDAEHYARIKGAREYRQGKTSFVSGLQSPEPRILRIVLERRYAPFLRVLAQQSAAVVPREEVNRPSADFGRRPTGTGPYRFSSWDSSGEIFLSMNPDYFEGRPYLDGIRIKTLSDLNPEATFEEFRKGELALSFVPRNRVATAQANPEWTLLSYPAFRFVYLGMNLRNPVMREINLRRAIHFAINKRKIMGEDPDFEVANNLIPLSLLGSSPGAAQDLYNTEKARQALEHSPCFKKQPLKLNVWHASPTEERRQLLTRLAECLKAVGIEAEITIASSLTQLLQKIHSGEAELFLYGEVIDFPDPHALVGRLFNSRSEGNLFGYSNPKVDELLLEGETGVSDELRAPIYAQIEKQVMQDNVIVPLFSARYSLVVQRSVQELDLNSLGLQYLPFRKVWLKRSR